MKSHHRPIAAIVAAGTFAAISFAAPAVRAQSASPSPSSQSDDLIEAAKRGLDKLEKQNKMREEFQSQMKTFTEKQNDMIKRLDALAKADENNKRELEAAMRHNSELERRAEAAVARQEETILKLNRALEKLEASENKPAASPSPAALPSTEPVKPSVSPSPSPTQS